MLPPLSVLLFFAEVARAASDNTTTTGCSTPSATACNHRSVWSLLASCGLTMLICVWHAVHPAVPLPYFKWYHTVFYRLGLMVVSFFAPEIMIETAVWEWFAAREMTQYVHDHRKYEWWTTTHSHFALNGGFAIRDNTTTTERCITTTDDIEALIKLMDEGNFVNPVVTDADIMDRSKSDALGKVILIVQLSWFTIQVIVRLYSHLTVTLVELDTVCMALLTLPLLFCWWNKPCCPGRPHIFLMRNVKTKVNDSTKTPLKVSDWRERRKNVEIETERSHWHLISPSQWGNNFPKILLPLCLAWATFGALHTIAWNYGFPSAVEKVMWRVSSLILTVSPVAFGVMVIVLLVQEYPEMVMFLTLLTFGVIGVASRSVLVILMLMSLRSLPPSSYEIVPWTQYIPHL